MITGINDYSTLCITSPLLRPLGILTRQGQQRLCKSSRKISRRPREDQRMSCAPNEPARGLTIRRYAHGENTI